jgi:hypothetical protein
MDLVLNNLISPVVLSFALGMIARAVRSDLEIPSAVYQALSIYLLFAIGLKGGVALSNTSVVELAKPVLATMARSAVSMRLRRPRTTAPFQPSPSLQPWKPLKLQDSPETVSCRLSSLCWKFPESSSAFCWPGKTGQEVLNRPSTKC